MAEEITIVRGGIMVIRKLDGTVIMAARGNGTALINESSVLDLIVSLATSQRPAGPCHVLVSRENLHNIVVSTEDGGDVHVQRADVFDAIAALAEALRTNPDGTASQATKEITGRQRRLSADGTPSADQDDDDDDDKGA